MTRISTKSAQSMSKPITSSNILELSITLDKWCQIIMMKTLDHSNRNRSTFPSKYANPKTANNSSECHTVSNSSLKRTPIFSGRWKSNSWTKLSNNSFICLKIRPNKMKIWISTTYRWVLRDRLLLMSKAFSNTRSSSSWSRTESMQARSLSWETTLKGSPLMSNICRSNLAQKASCFKCKKAWFNSFIQKLKTSRE